MTQTLISCLKHSEDQLKRHNARKSGIFVFDSDIQEQTDQRIAKYLNHLIKNNNYHCKGKFENIYSNENTLKDYVKSITDSVDDFVNVGVKGVIINKPLLKVKSRIDNLNSIIDLETKTKWFGTINVSKPNLHKKKSRILKPLAYFGITGAYAFGMYALFQNPNTEESGLWGCVFGVPAALFYGGLLLKERGETYEKEVLNLRQNIKKNITSQAKYLDKYFKIAREVSENNTQ